MDADLSSPVSALIPLRYSGMHYTVGLRIDGRDAGTFLLDTGSYRSFLTKRAFGQLRSGGGRVEKDGSLTVASLEIGRMRVRSMNFAPFPAQYRTPIEKIAPSGILGVDFLRRFRVGIDLNLRAMRLWSREVPVGTVVKGWFPSMGSPVLTLPLQADRHGNFRAPLTVENVSVPMQIDVASQDTYLDPSLLPYLRGRTKAGYRDGVFFDGRSRYELHRIGWIGTDQFAFSKDAVVGFRRIGGVPGIAGQNLLRGVRLLLDYPEGRLYTLRKGDQASKLPEAKYTGAYFILSNGSVVRWAAGEAVRVPAGCRYGLPHGYVEVLRRDGGLNLYPPGMAYETSGSVPLAPDERPSEPPSRAASSGHHWRWIPGEGWREIASAKNLGGS